MRLPAWMYVALVLLVVWAATLWVSFDRGRERERSTQRAQFVVRERAVIDSIEHVRDSIGRAAAAALRVRSSSAAALPSIDSGVARHRRVVTIVDTNRVVVSDTARGTSTSVIVPHEIIDRMRSDSMTIDVLRAQSRHDATAIDALLQLVRADALALARRDSLIAKLSLPPSQPPLLDRAIARVTVPLAKVGVAGGIVYGVYRLARSLIATR